MEQEPDSDTGPRPPPSPGCWAGFEQFLRSRSFGEGFCIFLLTAIFLVVLVNAFHLQRRADVQYDGIGRDMRVVREDIRMLRNHLKACVTATGLPATNPADKADYLQTMLAEFAKNWKPPALTDGDGEL